MQQKPKTVQIDRNSSIFNEQINVPSQKSIYQELVREIGITSPIQKKLLRSNFKKKYEQHFRLLSERKNHESSFQASKQKSESNFEQRLIKLKQKTIERQSLAEELKLQKIGEKKQKMKQNSSNWEQIVLKNKQQYNQRIKRSVQDIQLWNQKCWNSQKNKEKILGSIIDHSRGHNNHVAKVSISHRSSSFSHENPEHQILKAKTERSLSPYERKMLSVKSKRGIRLINTKKQIDQHLIERTLTMNVKKQKKIAEARALKNQITLKRHKLITDKSLYYEEQFKKNHERLEEVDQMKKNQLDKRLRSPPKKSKNISLPLISTKEKKQKSSTYLTEPVFDNSQKYNKLMMDKLRNMSNIMRKYYK